MVCSFKNQATMHLLVLVSVLFGVTAQRFEDIPELQIDAGILEKFGVNKTECELTRKELPEILAYLHGKPFRLNEGRLEEFFEWAYTVTFSQATSSLLSSLEKKPFRSLQRKYKQVAECVIAHGLDYAKLVGPKLQLFLKKLHEEYVNARPTQEHYPDWAKHDLAVYSDHLDLMESDLEEFLDGVFRETTTVEDLESKIFWFGDQDEWFFVPEFDVLSEWLDQQEELKKRYNTYFMVYANISDLFPIFPTMPTISQTEKPFVGNSVLSIPTVLANGKLELYGFNITTINETADNILTMMDDIRGTPLSPETKQKLVEVVRGYRKMKLSEAIENVLGVLKSSPVEMEREKFAKIMEWTIAYSLDFVYLTIGELEKYLQSAQMKYQIATIEDYMPEHARQVLQRYVMPYKAVEIQVWRIRYSVMIDWLTFDGIMEILAEIKELDEVEEGQVYQAVVSWYKTQSHLHERSKVHSEVFEINWGWNATNLTEMSDLFYAFELLM